MSGNKAKNSARDVAADGAPLPPYGIFCNTDDYYVEDCTSQLEEVPLADDDDDDDGQAHFIKLEPSTEDEYDVFEVVEYIGEDGLEEVDTVTLPSHMLLHRKDANGVQVLHCLQCAVDFDTEDDFAAAHNEATVEHEYDDDPCLIEEQQWDVVDDVVVEAPEGQCEIASEQYDDDGETSYYEQQQQQQQQQQQIEEQQNELDEYAPSATVDVKEELNDDDEKKYFCCECQSLFNSMEVAEMHDCPGLRTATEEMDETGSSPKGKPSHKCSMCDKEFASKKALLIHSRSHKAKKAKATLDKFFCVICNTVFSTEKDLRLHMKMHNKRVAKSIQEVLPEFAKNQYNELNQFYCEICNKSFEQNLLEVHRNMHQNVEEFTCNICNRQFENLLSYEVHMQIHVGGNKHPKSKRMGITDRLVNAKTSYPCQYCGHVFPRPFEKVKHERIHTGEKPYECEVCGKKFRVSYSLTLHLRTHTDIRPYVCSTCNKRFKSHSVYAHHLKTHQSERAYKCDICGKTYRTSVQLNSHRNAHTKPYSCPDCNRPFSSLYYVKAHMKTHSKGSKSSENLKHRCTVCGAVYARIFALRYHMRDQHSINEDGSIPESAVDALESGADCKVEETDEAAVLIAAAAGADSAAYMDHTGADMVDHEPTSKNAVILQGDEVIVDNYHTEEIVDNWLTE